MRLGPPIRKGPKVLPAQRGVEHNELVVLEVEVVERRLAFLAEGNPERALVAAILFYCGARDEVEP